MTDDIIEQAVSDVSDTEERTAMGSIDDNAVTLRKEDYGPAGREGMWRITVHVNESDVPNREIARLTENEADDRFEMLKNKHDLVEGFETL